MCGWSIEADLASDTGIFTGGNDINMHTAVEQAFSERIKIGVFRNLETHSVESGRISFTQNDTVPVEFVESLEEGAPTLHAYKIESNSVAVVQDGLFEVENPQLHVPRAQYTGHSHFSSPCSVSP